MQPADIVSFFCRHLVGLCVAYRHAGDCPDQPTRFSASSGTLIFLDNALCFLTAGHVLKGLAELRNHAEMEIKSVVLADTFGADTVSNLPIPFDLKSAKLFYVDDDDEGLDFGIIAIEPHYGRLLAKNGLVALSEENWKHQHRLNFDRFALLGLPEEMTTGQLSSDNSGAAAAMLFLTPTNPAPGRRLTHHQQFVAKLESPLPKSPKGMSGGPIFGFRFDADNQLGYWIVAIQSSWDPGSRTSTERPCRCWRT